MTNPHSDPDWHDSGDYTAQRTIDLIALLEDKTGATVSIVFNESIARDDPDSVTAFKLTANNLILCAVEHQPGDAHCETIDILGYLFFYVFGRTEGEA